METIIGIAGTIIGVILGGVISWLHSKDQRNHEIAKERRQLLLSKYEELHELLSSVQGCAYDLLMQLISEAAYDVSFDASKIKNKMPMNQVKMIIDFYIPELKVELEYLNKQTVSLYQIVFKFMVSENKSKADKAELAITANELSDVIAKTITSMKEKLANGISNALKNA
jgi:hypothetical protein